MNVGNSHVQLNVSWGVRIPYQSSREEHQERVTLRCQMMKYRNRKASKGHTLWGSQDHPHKVRPALYTFASSGPKHDISWKNIQTFSTNEKWQRSFKGIPDRPGAGLGDSGLWCMLSCPLELHSCSRSGNGGLKGTLPAMIAIYGSSQGLGELYLLLNSPNSSLEW